MKGGMAYRRCYDGLYREYYTDPSFPRKQRGLSKTCWHSLQITGLLLRNLNEVSKMLYIVFNMVSPMS